VRLPRKSANSIWERLSCLRQRPNVRIRARNTAIGKAARE
jgi:hypothetical protein